MIVGYTIMPDSEFKHVDEIILTYLAVIKRSALVQQAELLRKCVLMC